MKPGVQEGRKRTEIKNAGTELAVLPLRPNPGATAE